MTKSIKTYSRQRKNENFYKQAKQIEVRARSYFKLEQLDEKFSLVKDDMLIIDLGAAPGGWLEYLDRKMKSGKIVGIDLLEIKKQFEFSEKVEIIQDDFANIEDYVSEKFDLVLSDMAPEFCGDSKVDRGRTHQLNVKTLEFCQEHLKEGGNLAFKSFEGEDLAGVRTFAKKMFVEVKEFKPESSQKKSAEIFVICVYKK